MYLWFWIVAAMYNLFPLGDSKIWEIPLPKHLQDCYNRVQNADIKTYVGSTYSWLCENSLTKFNTEHMPSADLQKSSYYKQLSDKLVESTPSLVGKTRAKRQVTANRCLRKEYRMLSDDERNRFHNAINTLKRDTSVEPNKYDAIALLHGEGAVFTAHGGAGFLGWHRIFLLILETALREVDPTVCLPYWDSSLDNELQDSTQSPIWSPTFLGNSQGPVVSGPFANWTTPQGGQLIRNVGTDGELFSATAISDILSRTRHHDIITSQQVDPRYDLEFHHAAVHVFCGGSMSQLDTAAFDPVFFLHHAFVDYIWELFRTNLKAQGIDPQVFPDITDSDPRHLSTAPTGFGDLTQADGYLEALTETFQYDAAPVCSARSPDCGSRYLVCQVATGRCLPTVLNAVVTTPTATIPTLPSFSGNATDFCKKKSNELPIQNDYCCDKSCDTNKWAMIPVKVVSVRPPKFKKYSSYPVQNGQINYADDIYSPRAYSQTKRYITSRLSNPKTYKRCAEDSVTGQVFLSSRGINYNGFYKESAIVDQRLAVSLSMGFIGVKKPLAGEVTHALLRAHDSCGRVCHTACKDPVTKEFKDCSGAVAISTEPPLMYGSDYDEAVMSVFDYEFNSECPRFKTDNFFITFYCDYHNDFPYAETVQNSPPKPVVTAPIEIPLPTSGCKVTSDCTLSIPCVSQYRQCNFFNEKHVCQSSCRAYAVCTYGRYFQRLCPEGHYFDNSSKRCIAGYCQPGSPRIVRPRFGFGH
ncbi:uncharacterized protein LOC131956104 [Physella acuta]|uniref:uncharacterized protein LOC131956104 n=1 Tax=Physella acuta TaxID=109671 RepID=UPI0027DB790A|nr:uncharacterized protein LOC131956104 [Physella acuta]